MRNKNYYKKSEKKILVTSCFANQQDTNAKTVGPLTIQYVPKACKKGRL